MLSRFRCILTFPRILALPILLALLLGLATSGRLSFSSFSVLLIPPACCHSRLSAFI